ncbi:hypothetical protein JMUB7524_27360 [Staphylococcus aureus]
MSRGLGDVYKRQLLTTAALRGMMNDVSYTHLTLPTNREV